MDEYQVIKEFIIKNIIKDEDIDIEKDEPLITGGLIDSFDLVKLVVFLEEKFKAKIDNSKVSAQKMNTISNIINILKESQNE